MSVIIIAAVDRDNGIGIDGNLPWKLKADMDHFKATTVGKAIVMGRKTFESIGRPLPGRTNFVVSRTNTNVHANVKTYSSLAQAAIKALDEHRDVYIIGGSEIYKQAIEFADELLITHIQASYKCNEFFPRIDSNVWKVADSEPFPFTGTGPILDLTRYVRQ